MANKKFIVKNGLGVTGDIEATGNIVVQGTITGDGSGLSGVTSYTQTNFDSDLATKTTDDLTEGSNQYFTTARARAAMVAGDGINYDSATGVISVPAGAAVDLFDSNDFDIAFAAKSTTDLSEGSNLYYTTARADSAFDERLAIKTTDDLSEGSNLYYTTARADSAFDARFDSSFDERLAIKTTDDIAEGSTNLYYDSATTVTVARNSVSATDAGGDGSFAYNAGTGVFTYTGPSASEVRAHFSAGTGVTLSSGEISIGQAVGTGDTPTFTGLSANSSKITALATPTVSTDAANKSYVDEVASGLSPAPAVTAATTANLSGTFDSDGTAAGYLGVGTLTATGNGAIGPIDGVDIDSGDSLLLKDQTVAFQNGRYNVSHAGDSDNPWALVRCSQCDSSDDIPGKFIFITGGTLYGNTGWTLTVDDPETFVINQDPINPVQFSGAGTYTGGYGINLDGTQFSLDSAETLVLTRNGLSGGNGLTYSSSTGAFAVGAGTGITVDSDAISTNDAEIVHDNLSGFVANEHIDHSSVSITAGTGLSGGGDITSTRTINIANTGVVAATYGDSSTIPVVTVNAQGQITGVTGASVNIPAGYDATNFDSDFNTKTTDDLTQGAVNRYFSNTLARGAVSAVDAGGDGSFSYNGGTGEFTYTGPSAAETRAHFQASTGITFDSASGSISITNTGVSAATYGDSSTIPQITVNAQGQITAVVGASVNIPAGYDATNFDSDFGTKTTTNLTEGTNQYYTAARARSAISITDAGGDGSLGYNSGTGVITYTGPSASEVRAHFSAGTGIGLDSSGVISNTGVTSVNSVTGAVTAANLLTAIKTVDGDSSGLDADLLDGQEGSYYRIDVYNAAGTLLN